MQIWRDNINVIMDKALIAEYNQCICETEKCDVVNIVDFPYTKAERDCGENVSLKGYGIIINEADVRAVPTREAYILAEDDMGDDQYQKSTLKVGEGVWILEHFDEEWTYVRARNCAGWVETRYIAECTREEFLTWLEAENFVVVTRPADIRCGRKVVHFSMGSRLLLKDKLSIMRPTVLNGHLACEVLDAKAVRELEYHEGYLPYTTENVLSQAMKLLDIPYGWGNADHGLDCSGFIGAVYECFGIYLPRNTSAMRTIPYVRTDLSGLSCEEKIARLRQVKPGSLLLFQGHVMMWLGIQNGTSFIIHEVSGYRDDKGEINNVRKCVITPLDILRKNGENILEAVDVAVEVKI